MDQVELESLLDTFASGLSSLVHVFINLMYNLYDSKGEDLHLQIR